MISVEKCYIGIDLGGTKMAGAAADSEGSLLTRETVPTPKEGGGKVLEALKSLVTRLAKGMAVETIAIGIPGLVDLDTGSVVSAGNLKWLQVPLVSILQKEFPKALIYIDNDVNVAAYGELRFGAAQNCRDFIYVTVGTGIGGGIFMDGRMLQGPRWVAGEVGHMVMQPEGLPCSCGGQGCLETLAAAPAFAREGRLEAIKDPGSLLHRLAAENGGEISAKILSLAYDEGDAAAIKAFDRSAGWLGVGMASLVNIFNPSLLVIGGGVSLAGEKLLKIVRQKIAKHAMEVQGKHVQVVTSGLGDEAGLFGAMALAIAGAKEAVAMDADK